MQYKNKKNSFKSPYLGEIIKAGQVVELERELLGIEKNYLIPHKEEKKEEPDEE